MLKLFKFLVKLIDNDVINEGVYMNCCLLFKFMGFVGVFMLLVKLVGVVGWFWEDEEEKVVFKGKVLEFS